MTKNTKHWIRGLIGANIAGGAGALASGPIVNMIAPETFNLTGGLRKLLIFMVASFILHMIIGGAAYLQKSPLPGNEIPPDPAKP